MTIIYYNRDGEPMSLADMPNDNRVARTVVGDATVSTVWLFGIDHGSGLGSAPVIFETMIFGGEHDEEMIRYSSEESALRGHLKIVDRLRSGRDPFSCWDAE